MKKISFLLGILLLTCLNGHAQKIARYGGMGFFSFGISDLRQPGVNSLLASQGYTGLQSRQISMGGQGFGIINNFLIGGQGGSLGEQQFSRAQTTGRIQNSYGSFMMGYVFSAGKRALIYPVIGYGSLSTEITLEDNNTTASMQTAFTNPNQITVIRGEIPSFDLSLNFVIPIFGNMRGGGGPMAGISAGVIYCPNSGNYTMNGHDLTDVPGQQNSGFYIRLHFGGGGFSSDVD